jgi:hypothetical protein
LEKCFGLGLRNLNVPKKYEPFSKLLFLAICAIPYIYYGILNQGEKIMTRIIAEEGGPTEEARQFGFKVFAILFIVFALSIFSLVSSWSW